MTPNPDRAHFALKTTTVGDAHGAVIEVSMVYLDSDPHAVHFVFDPIDRRIRWEFAREQLVETLGFRPESFPRGDVRVYRRNASTLDVSLRGREGLWPTFRFPLEDVRLFLAMTLALVPLGRESEFVNWADAETALGLAPGQLTGSPAA